MEDSEQFMKFKNNVLRKFLKDIKKKYKIIDQQGDEVSDENLLQLNKFNRCQGVVTTSSGSFGRCSKNASENFSYCKLHLKKEIHKKMYQSKETKEQQENKIVIIDAPSGQNDFNNKLEKKFIQDSFYYIDSYFIYAIDDNRRVGIVEQGEYILTDDPFVLGLI
jgi:rRNA pseudouridine-1189 N-methylase Emg1 (Nep1/Mra1 family)